MAGEYAARSSALPFDDDDCANTGFGDVDIIRVNTNMPEHRAGRQKFGRDGISLNDHVAIEIYVHHLGAASDVARMKGGCVVDDPEVVRAVRVKGMDRNKALLGR
jgi:hypothetical protein